MNDDTTKRRARPHESARGHVTGGAIYTDDQRPPTGLLTVWPVQATHARARILSVDTTEALAAPGVVTILTHEDVPGENDASGHQHDEPLLPGDEVQYWGQPVVWVVAESAESARRAAELVRLELEPHEPILTIEAAIRAGSFLGRPIQIRRGDPEAALRSSERTLEGELSIGGQDHFYLETQVAWALPDGEGNTTVYASTQHPTETQTVVAKVLGVPNNRVTTVCLRMGGGFGGKESQANAWAAIAALAAHKTGRPARVRLRREQDMTITGKRHPFLGRYRVGFDPSGLVTALEVDLFSDGGWCSDLSEPVLSRALFHLDNAYYLPDVVVRGRVCRTNKTSQTAFRGFGGPQGMLVVEEVMDRVARTLGIPADEVRERNFYRGDGESNTTHYGQFVLDNRLERVWSETKELSSFGVRRAEIANGNASAGSRRRGLAVTPVKFGISFTNTPMNQAGAFVLVYLDGSIQLNHGGTEMGQGLHTKMLQVAARSLGVGIERFRMMPTSTDKVPNTSPTAASSGADLNGQAVRDACETLRARLAGVAEGLLGVRGAEALQFENDEIWSPGEPQRRLTFDEVVRRAYLERVSLSATGYYRTPNLHYDVEAGRGRPFHYFAFGAAACEVEVDGLTGAWRLVRVDIVHDAGDSLNPLVDRGQIEGGFVQGMGWLTMEETYWDDSGRFLSSAPSTYKIPTVAEVPEALEIRLLERAAQDGVIYGSKAVGEPPLMLAIAVREAIREAVAAFGERAGEPTPEGIALACPATPEAILRAVDEVRAWDAHAERAMVTGD